ncbi:MAG: hypothetical protein ACKV2T_22140 [Kofleriaceae bacterium]
MELVLLLRWSARDQCGCCWSPSYRFLVASPNLDELLALDVQTRLTLVQELGDSIAQDAQAGAELPVLDDERCELDHGLREDDEHPKQAIPWPEARARLRNGQ